MDDGMNDNVSYLHFFQHLWTNPLRMSEEGNCHIESLSGGKIHVRARNVECFLESQDKTFPVARRPLVKSKYPLRYKNMAITDLPQLWTLFGISF